MAFALQVMVSGLQPAIFAYCHTHVLDDISACMRSYRSGYRHAMYELGPVRTVTVA